MLDKLFEKLYLKVFVNIVIYRSHTVVYIELCNTKTTVQSIEESFQTVKLNNKVYEFISEYIKESPYYYISILDASSTQGAIHTCKSAQMERYFDKETSKYKCYNDRWAFYTSKSELTRLQQEYKEIGLDFVFSPFVLLANFFKDKINTHLAMFILIEENYITLSVFDNSELLFAKHLDMQNSHESDELLMDDGSDEELDLDIDSSIDLEDVDVMDDLDDFGDIEDLDSIGEIDEFAEDEEIQENTNDAEEDDAESGEFNEDYQRFSLIQSAINRFYKDDTYNSKFIEDTYIADGVGISGDLKRYLEEEMFLSVYVRNLDLCVEVCELAKAEIQ